MQLKGLNHASRCRRSTFRWSAAAVSCSASRPANVSIYSCARPSFQDLLGAIDFAVAKDDLARGGYTGAV